MAARRNYYVYLHRDNSGQIFYVGKGTGRRAWSTDRDAIWHKYLSERSGGVYSVEIVQDGLDSDSAEALESQLIDRYGERLVNIQNWGRKFDYPAIERFHTLRDANRKLLAQAKQLEKTDLAAAAAMYADAIIGLSGYAHIVVETGLVADLMGKPAHGDANIVERLSLCLIRLGRTKDALLAAERYFQEYPADRETGAGVRTLTRLEKAKIKNPQA